jgi:serine/threonine-protein kinase
VTEPRVLGDRYEIESMLGRGGMATVYRGRDRVLDRPVAIKVLAEKYGGDQKFVTRFQREARAAAGLNHRSIVSVYDTGDTDGEHYFVMELIQGETLADLLDRQRPLSSDHAARIAAGIAEALQAAHDQGLIHRDVKPGNVMLTPAGDVKVMDFGIARAASDDTLTQTGLILGTASYLSPEQSRGDPVDHRSDIYSLGCVAYEMLAGNPPFSANTPLSVAYKHVHDRPRPPSRTNSSVPPEMETVVMRALAKDPDDRFPSADAFRQAITEAAGGEATEPLGGDTAVLPAADTETLGPPPRPRRSLLPLAALAAALLVAGVLAIAMTGREEPRRDRGDRPQQGAEITPTPLETTPALLGVADAALAFQELVEVSLEAGLLEEEVALEALEDQQDALDAYASGDQDAALEHLDDADADIETSLAAGGIASSQVAVTLHDGIDVLRQAMLATPATTVEESPVEEGDGDDDDDQDEDEEDGGPGNSENAPGHVKKEEDDH